MTKFLNIDLDPNLGGNTSSDVLVSSQKAIKTYVDTKTPTKVSDLTNDTGFITKDGDINGTAAKAKADNAGNIIIDTYATKTALVNKQDLLISGTNIKTINSQSLLGSGNINISSGGTDLPDQTGNAGKFLTTDGTNVSWAAVNASIWGNISGTLSNQSDLQTALNAKQNTLTTAQQNAVNSGITSTKVSSYDTHIANKSNPHGVTKSQVGLGNVDNTSDANKPISTATQTALNAKQDKLTAGNGIKIKDNVISETLTNSANTWTGTQVYMATTEFNGEVDVRAGGPEITFINTEDDSTATPTAQQNYCLKMADKNGVTVSGYEYHHGTDGSKFAQIAVMHGSSTAVFNIGFNASGTMYADASSGIKSSMAGWFTNVYEKLGNKSTSFTSTTANNTNFPTTKAVVDYVSGAATKVDIDNSTITKNASGELQASAVLNQRTSGVLKSWTGTLAQYNALATKSDDTQYIITDDDSAGTNVYTKAEVDSLVNSVLATADYVVEFQAPTAANNYTWYRKYKSGWVEQGGNATAAGQGVPSVFTLPIEMSDTNYTIVCGKHAGDTAGVGFNIEPYTTTQFRAGIAYGEVLTRPFSWQVSGMAA